MIVVVCPYCGSKYVNFDKQTHTIKCNDCKKTFLNDMKLSNISDATFFNSMKLPNASDLTCT